jgi:hypothetical protein
MQNMLRGVLASDASDEEKLVAFSRMYMTLLHESAHVYDPRSA